jgi:Na+-driven multidrug efflux pump
VEARSLARVAVPAFLERVGYHFGFTMYVVLVAGLGDAAMAANQSLISVEAICFLSADGFGIAAAALVAQKLGAGRPEEARRAAWISARYAVATLSLFGVAALATRDVILPVFSGDPVVLKLGRDAVPVLAAAQPFMATSIVLGQAMRGAGRTKEVLCVSLLGGAVVRIAATYVFAITLGLGLFGAWVGSTLDWIVRTALLGALHLRRSGRLT